MENSPTSPFRLLVKSYANNVITRDEYIKIRSQLLKKLQSTGQIEEDDLNNFSLISKGTHQPKTEKSYSSSDWVIIALGLTASAVLAYILYG